MARPPLRFLVRQAATLVIMTSVVGVVGSAYAASLGGISSGSLDAWTYPAEIVTADVTPPTITASVTPAANPAGWNNTAVTVTFTCTDAQSGVATCTSPVTVSGEGAGQLVVGSATDLAGNTGVDIGRRQRRHHPTPGADPRRRRRRRARCCSEPRV